jgi:hypothetical protein
VSEWMLIDLLIYSGLTPNGCWYLLKKDGGLVFRNLNGCIGTINLNK